MTDDGQMCDESDSRRNYAWDWFRYHAEQRAKMLHFFFLITGILGAAYGGLLSVEVNLLETSTNGNKAKGVVERDIEDAKFAVMCFGLLTSVAFICLDFRNKRRVQLGEDVLRQIERTMFTSFQMADRRNNEIENGGILVREAEEEQQWQRTRRLTWIAHLGIKHGLWIPLIEGVVGVLFLQGLLDGLSHHGLKVIITSVVAVAGLSFLFFNHFFNHFRRSNSRGD